MPELSFGLPPLPESVRAARDRLRGLLDSWATEGKRQEVVLLLSEVVSNAVRYAPGVIHVTLTVFTDRVTARVRDENPRPPQPRAPDENGGRGLEVLRALATRWGVEHHPDDGKTVWFEVTETQ
jgi:two-component sensor histidine kinase